MFQVKYSNNVVQILEGQTSKSKLFVSQVKWIRQVTSIRQLKGFDPSIKQKQGCSQLPGHFNHVTFCPGVFQIESDVI